MPRREAPGDHRHKHGNEQWSAFLDAENRSYYYNSVTGESTYENPYYYSDDEDEDDISQLENEESQKRAKRHVRIQEAQNRQQRVKAANAGARGVGTEVVAYGQTYDTLPSQASWSGSDGEAGYGGMGVRWVGSRQSLTGSPLTSSQWYQAKDGGMHYFDSTTGQSYSQAIMEQRQAQDTGGSGSIGSAMLTHVSSSMSSTWEAADDGQGHLYYYNHRTGETTWEPPALLPASPDSGGFLTGGTPPMSEWVACDDQQGNLYYYNEKTGESTWEPPLLCLPPSESTGLSGVDTSSLAIVPLARSDETSSSSALTAVTGRWRYHNDTGEVTWEPSVDFLRELKNWDEAFDQDGNRFFVNTVSGQTAWHLPGTTPSHSSSSEEGQLQWESVWTDGGEQYYYNKLTGETSWEPPVLAIEQDPSLSMALVPKESVSSSSSGDTEGSAPFPALPYSTSGSRPSNSSLLALPQPDDKEATQEEDIKFLAALMARQLVLNMTPGVVKRVATELHIDRLRKAAEREQMLARTYVATHNHNRTRAVTTAALGTKERLQAAADKDQADDEADMMVMTRVGLTKRPESGGDTEGGIWSPRSTRKGTPPEAQSGVKSPRAEGFVSPRGGAKSPRAEGLISPRAGGLKSPRKGNDASGSSLAYRPPSEESDLAKQRRAAISMPKAAASSRFIRAVNLLTSVGSGSTTLREIDLSSEKIGDAGASHLSTLLVHAPLVTLVLNDNDITCAGAKALAGAFKTNRSIRTLHLAANLIHDDGVRALTLAMWDNPALRVLNLNANPIHAEGAKQVALMIIEPACKLSSLFMNGPPVSRKLLEDSIQHSNKSETQQRFSTTDNSKELKVKRLGDMGTYFLSAALLSSQTVALHTLWLTSCNIGPSGARALATTLYYNPHITNINLSLNKIEERGAAYLCRALQVNTTLQVLILDRCGLQIATLKRIKHLLTNKPKLSWDQQKDYAATLAEDVKWLREMCDVGKFPFRKESSNPTTPAMRQLGANGQQDEQDSDEGSTSTNDEQDKVPDWVTSKDRNVLRSLLSMPEAEMKQWSHMWVQHTAALVILYQERLSFELCQLEESEVVNEEEVQEVKAVLHAMLENGKRELSALHKAHQRASDTHRELAGFLDAALKTREGLHRRLRVGQMGVEATRAVLATLADGTDEKAAMSERLEMEEHLLLEAKAQQAEVDREVEEARGEEQRAREAKQVTAQALRESVADDGERHVELHDEVQGCLWARMRIAARKARMERLAKETAALADRIRAEVVRRVKADEFKALVPFTSGFSSLDDLVRHSIVEEHHRHASMLEAQEIKEHIAETMKELDGELDELMGCAKKVYAIKMRHNAQQQEQASGSALVLLPHETEALRRVLEILERYYATSPLGSARHMGEASASHPETSTGSDRASSASTVVSSDSGTRGGVDLGAGFRVGTAETANRSPTASSDQTSRSVPHTPNGPVTAATSLPSSSIDAQRSVTAPATATSGVTWSGRDDGSFATHSSHESQGSASRAHRTLPALSDEEETAAREVMPALRQIVSAPSSEPKHTNSGQELPQIVTSSMRRLKALAFNMRGHMDTLVNAKGLAVEEVRGRDVDLQACRQRLAVVARDHFMLVEARSAKAPTVSRFLSRKSGVEVMLAQATPNDHIKAAEKVIKVAAEAEQTLGDRRQSVGTARKIQLRRGAEARLRTPLEQHWDALRAQGVFAISKADFKQIKYKYQQNKHRQVITKTLRSPVYRATVRNLEQLGMKDLFAEAERAGVFADAEETGEKARTSRDVVHMLAKKQFSQKTFTNLG